MCERCRVSVVNRTRGGVDSTLCNVEHLVHYALIVRAVMVAPLHHLSSFNLCELSPTTQREARAVRRWPMHLTRREFELRQLVGHQCLAERLEDDHDRTIMFRIQMRA